MKRKAPASHCSGCGVGAFSCFSRQSLDGLAAAEAEGVPVGAGDELESVPVADDLDQAGGELGDLVHCEPPTP